MTPSKVFAALALLAATLTAPAKDKKPVVLPVEVLKARTVLVIVDPTAGVDVQGPNANRVARANVEPALQKWGRFALVHEGYTADFVVMICKGNGKMVQPMIGGTSANGIPPVNVGLTTTPDATTTRAGGRWGNAGVPNDPSNAGDRPGTPQPQIEAGPTRDTFAVYRGGSKDDPNSSPLDAPAVWRYTGKDELESPSVPAVEAFRKAIAESEKQVASTP